MVAAARREGGWHHIVVPPEELDKVLQDAANAHAAGQLCPMKEEVDEDETREDSGLLDEHAAECETGADEPLSEAPKHTQQQNDQTLVELAVGSVGARLP